MKKLTLFLVFILSILTIALIIVFMAAPKIISHRLSNKLNVPVSIGSIFLSPHQLSINKLFIGNPSKAKSKTALKTKKIKVESSYSKITGKKLIIDEIELDDIEVGIELFNRTGDQNNWSSIMKTNDDTSKEKPTKKTSQKKYLIKKLSLNNILVTLVRENGKKSTFPPIKNLTFTNISSETGFPLDEIEKAIIQVFMRSVFIEVGLPKLIKTLNPMEFDSESTGFSICRRDRKRPTI